MDFNSQQKKFDDVKWYDSILSGCDRCGSYDFCDVCDKAQPNPCARAAAKANVTLLEGFTKVATVHIKIG